jgi:hypothetical protein
MNFALEIIFSSLLIVVYLGLLAIAASIRDPLGDDIIDFSRTQLLSDVWSSLVAYGAYPLQAQDQLGLDRVPLPTKLRKHEYKEEDEEHDNDDEDDEDEDDGGDDD